MGFRQLKEIIARTTAPVVEAVDDIDELPDSSGSSIPPPPSLKQIKAATAFMNWYSEMRKHIQTAGRFTAADALNHRKRYAAYIMFYGGVPLWTYDLLKTKDLLSPEACLVAVAKLGVPLLRVPLQYWTPDIIDSALEADGRNMGAIPPARRTPEMYVKALLSIPQNDIEWLVNDTPDQYKDENWWEIAVSRHPSMIQRMDAQFNTPEFRQRVFDKTIDVFRYMDMKHKTFDMAVQAVRKHPDWLNKYVPKSMRARIEPAIAALNQARS